MKWWQLSYCDSHITHTSRSQSCWVKLLIPHKFHLWPYQASTLEIFTISILVPRHLTFHIYRDPNYTVFFWSRVKVNQNKKEARHSLVCSCWWWPGWSPRIARMTARSQSRKPPPPPWLQPPSGTRWASCGPQSSPVLWLANNWSCDH